MIVKPIRSASDYEANVARLEDLIDAEPGSPESDELDILATLIERYETERFPIALPSPLAAIRFRMEQDALTPRDLEPYIGSRARVSEVLSGVRPLSIDMIRALHEHLGIPAEVLIQPEPEPETKTAVVELAKPALKQLSSWGLIGTKETFQDFLARAFGGGALAPAMLRKTRTERTNAKTDFVAVKAWCAAALLCSENEPVTGQFDPATVTTAARSLTSLSLEEDGPARAKALLAELGIILVLLPHLPGTHLDGASLRRADGVPVIALTLRRDRIDGFWFTLLHELAHVVLHLTGDRVVILDDLEISSSEKIEKEADDWAQEALIPSSMWTSFQLKGAYTSMADVLSLARRAEVNPAIVAGRWQRQNRNFRKFSGLLGHNTVRDNFPKFGCVIEA